MFSYFESYFKVNYEYKEGKNAFSVFMKTFEGHQFNRGMFNIFKIKDLPKWTESVELVFSAAKGKFQLFGYDWLGRCFAVDLRNSTYGQIVMFDPTSLKVYEIPCGFVEFLNEEIPQRHEVCLASEFFHEWRECCNDALPLYFCVGYNVPLYLNGDDSFENLGVVDMEVYWDITAQLKQAINNLQDGQTIEAIVIE